MHELFKKRHSFRKYLDKPISDDQIQSILTAAMASPSAMHENPWEFVVIRDKERLEKLSSFGQYISFVKSAPVAIIVCVKETKFWIQDGSIAAAHIYLETTNQGLGTCWGNIYLSDSLFGGPREEEFRRELNIPDDYRVLCIMPIGYPDREKEDNTDAVYDEEKVHEGEW